MKIVRVFIVLLSVVLVSVTYAGEQSNTTFLNMKPVYGSSYDVLKLKASGDDSALMGYLIDAPAMQDQAIRGLRLHWEHPHYDWVNPVRLLASQDGKHWQPLNKLTALYEWDYEGDQIANNLLPLSNLTLPYLLLRFEKPIVGADLASITADVFDEPLGELHSTRLHLRRSEQGYTFILKKRGPVLGLSIKTPIQDRIVKAHLYSRAKKGEIWQHRKSIRLYNLDLNGYPVLNSVEMLEGNIDRYWLLTFDNLYDAKQGKTKIYALSRKVGGGSSL